MRFLPTALAAMLLAVLLGCGPVFAPSVNDASDEVATAAEIVEAGAPVAADRAGDGRLLAVYSVVHSEGPEVSQTAWRLYDADGVTVASRSTTAAVRARSWSASSAASSTGRRGCTSPRSCTLTVGWSA